MAATHLHMRSTCTAGALGRRLSLQGQGSFCWQCAVALKPRWDLVVSFRVKGRANIFTFCHSCAPSTSALCHITVLPTNTVINEGILVDVTMNTAARSLRVCTKPA